MLSQVYANYSTCHPDNSVVQSREYKLKLGRENKTTIDGCVEQVALSRNKSCRNLFVDVPVKLLARDMLKWAIDVCVK